MVKINDEPEIPQVNTLIKKEKYIPRKTTPRILVVPTKEELRAMAWCFDQAWSIYKKYFQLDPKPTPSAMIIIRAYKYLKKSKDKVVRRYLKRIDVKTEGIDLEEY